MKVLKDEPKQTFVVFVLDDSGSMASVKNQTVSGFNEQLQAVQKMEAPDHEVFISFLIFSDPNRIETIRNWVKPSELSPLSINEYRADGGSTALYDAMMAGIRKVEEKLDVINKSKNAALVLFVTDGGENNSREFGGEAGRLRLKEKIQALTNTDRFTFTFMGTEGIEAVQRNYGIAYGNATQFQYGAAGMHTNTASNVDAIHAYSKMRSAGGTFSASFYDSSSKDDEDSAVNLANGNTSADEDETTKTNSTT